MHAKQAEGRDKGALTDITHLGTIIHNFNVI